MDPIRRQQIRDRAAQAKAAKAAGVSSPPAKKDGRKRAPSAAECDKRVERKGRLPAPANLVCRWNGSKWYVVLTVNKATIHGDSFPTVDQFEGEGDGLFKTIDQVDTLYRKSLENASL